MPPLYALNFTSNPPLSSCDFPLCPPLQVIIAQSLIKKENVKYFHFKSKKKKSQ